MKYSEETLTSLKNMLLSERDRIQERIASLVSQDPYTDPDRLNDNAASDTEANEESSHERMEALERELRAHIAEINEALQRIETGSYGVCVSCGNPIGEARLKIKPAALYCMACEEKKKKK